MEQLKVKSYGKRVDKSMQTFMQLIRSFYKMRTKEINYLQSHNLTIQQFTVLEVLYHKGNLNIGAITKITMSTPGNTTVVVKNLKRDDWIISLKDENDKRASILSITNKGKEIIENIFPQHAVNINDYFSVLDEQELDVLYTLLKKVKDAQ